MNCRLHTSVAAAGALPSAALPLPFPLSRTRRELLLFEVRFAIPPPRRGPGTEELSDEPMASTFIGRPSGCGCGLYWSGEWGA